VDLSNSDNAGLDIPINTIRPIVDKYTTPFYGLSRADIWALAALVSAEISQNSIAFPMEYVGRVDCENAQDVCLKENGSIFTKRNYCYYGSAYSEYRPSREQWF
jgi:catalase (peroxidase I)